MNNLQRLFRPNSIAVIGGKWAAEAIHQCLKFGYQGDIWPVHPRHQTIEGLQVYQCIEDLPNAPDAAFIGVNREISIDIMRALAQRDSGGAVCFSSGFAETQTDDDPHGADLQQALLDASGDMPFLGPNCYGFINYCDGALLWPDSHGGSKLAPDDSGAAIIVQSSNIAINISMQNRGLPLAYIMTVGNQSKVGLSEVGLALLDDPRVSCLGLHIEGFDSIEGMQKLALKAFELGKPIAILKIGKSAQAQIGTFSHTASLAGAYTSTCAFIKRLGMAQVETIPALLDTLLMLHAHGPLPGFSLSAMVSSGGEASLIADIASDKAVYFPALPPDAKQKTQNALGARVTVANPLDFHTYIWGDREATTSTFSGILSANFDLNILILDFPSPPLDDSNWQLTAEAFLDARNSLVNSRKSDIKTALVSCLAENLPGKQLIEQYLQQDMPCFGGFEEILNATTAAAQLGQTWQDWQAREVPPSLCCVDSRLEENAYTLNEYEAKSLLAEFGLLVPKSQCLKPQNDLLKAANALGYPLAVKALGFAHKTELNAVRLGISNDTELLSATGDLFSMSEEIMLERMVENSAGELLIGITRDAQFGLLLTIAMGGVLVELLKDSVGLLLPTDRNQIQTALNTLKIAPLFSSYRGQPAWDFNAIVDSVLALQRFALAYKDRLLELDINPLMVGTQNNDGGAIVADALIILLPEE